MIVATNRYPSTVRGDSVYMPAAISCSRIASSPTAVKRLLSRSPSHVAPDASAEVRGALVQVRLDLAARP